MWRVAPLVLGPELRESQSWGSVGPPPRSPPRRGTFSDATMARGPALSKTPQKAPRRRCGRRRARIRLVGREEAPLPPWGCAGDPPLPAVDGDPDQEGSVPASCARCRDCCSYEGLPLQSHLMLQEASECTWWGHRTRTCAPSIQRVTIMPKDVQLLVASFSSGSARGQRCTVTAALRRPARRHGCAELQQSERTGGYPQAPPTATSVTRVEVAVEILLRLKSEN